MPYQRRRQGRTLKVLPAVAGTALRVIGGRVIKNVARRVGKAAIARAAAYLGVGTAVGTAGYAVAGSRKRRRVNDSKQMNSAGEMMTGSKRTVGPKSALTTSHNQLLKMAVTQRTLRFQRVNPLNRTTTVTQLPGSLFLSNDVVGGNTVVPMHVFCLNNTINNEIGSNGPLYSTTVLDNGTIQFNLLTGLVAGTSGASATDWQVESKTGFETSNTGHRYIQHQWYDIRMNCYGAQNQPTIYDITVVRFSDGYLDPLENPSNVREGDDRRGLYQSMVRPYMVNPILPGSVGGFLKGKIKVLHRTRFTIQPTLNTERDLTPASKIVKIFYRDGKVYDYLYTGDGFDGTDADARLNTAQFDEHPAFNLGVPTVYSESPVPRSRIWLVIKALNTTPTGAVILQDATNTPSYDLVVRQRNAFLA